VAVAVEGVLTILVAPLILFGLANDIKTPNG